MELRLPFLCRWWRHKLRPGGVPNPAIKACARCGLMVDTTKV